IREPFFVFAASVTHRGPMSVPTLVSRSSQPRRPDTVVRVGERVALGSDAIALIAGPCSVEGRAMLLDTAHAVRASGATMLRGGAFKPRTSPYAFQGL